ncbi:hypothetical protein ScPMuIL_001522 [Solemya velum]
MTLKVLDRKQESDLYSLMKKYIESLCRNIESRLIGTNDMLNKFGQVLEPATFSQDEKMADEAIKRLGDFYGTEKITTIEDRDSTGTIKKTVVEPLLNKQELIDKEWPMLKGMLKGTYRAVTTKDLCRRVIVLHKKLVPNMTCQVTKYGQDCASTCDNCDGGLCHHVTGSCDQGCTPGWLGSYCNQACQSPAYGQNCTSTCDNCIGGACDHVTGSCDHGCIPGWQGTHCTDVCQSPAYGQNCASTCDKCDGGTCHHATGSCDHGCVPGWNGSHCTDACQSPAYGQDCASACDNCGGGACHHVTGSCDLGCLPGWEGTFCTDVNGSSYDALKLLDSLDDLLTGVITAQEVCPNIQLTYGVYHVLAEGLVNMGRNVQKHSPHCSNKLIILVVFQPKSVI